MDDRTSHRRHVCRMLALLWIFPSLGALVLLMRGDGWTSAPPGAGWWAGITLEGWVAGGLLATHLALLWLGWRKDRA